MNVELLHEAYARGVARSMACRKRDAQHRWDWHPVPEAQQIIDGESAAAEFLVAQYYSLAWLSSEDTGPTKCDLEGGVDVHWTDRENGSLIVHAQDADDVVAVLVTGNMPEGIIRGWLPIAEAKQPRWWRAQVRYPAYFVPQDALRYDDLRAWLRERGRI